jgi:surface protein
MTLEFQQAIAASARSTLLTLPQETQISVNPARFLSTNGWGIVYDCSNLIGGECIGRDAAGNCISDSGQCFETTRELRDAVDEYLEESGPGSRVASIYGFPIGNWCVSKIQDFSFLFSLCDDGHNPRRANLAVADFNEEISRGDVSNAATMKSMFAGVYYQSTYTHFNQPLADWNVSSVMDMAEMFQYTDSFNQPLDSWNVSLVTNMRNMSNSASSFNQPIGKWDVSNVSQMFFHAASFNQPIDNWNISSVTETRGMFEGASSFK